MKTEGQMAFPSVWQGSHVALSEGGILSREVPPLGNVRVTVYTHRKLFPESVQLFSSCRQFYVCLGQCLALGLHVTVDLKWHVGFRS